MKDKIKKLKVDAAERLFTFFALPLLLVGVALFGKYLRDEEDE